MSRSVIRHFGRKCQPYVLWKGELPERIRLMSHRDEQGHNWVNAKSLRIYQREQRARLRAEKAAAREFNRPKFGKGSGRVGGGRGAAHAAHHRCYVNADLPARECPVCFDRKLWVLWLKSDCGRWRDVWENWATRQVLWCEYLQHLESVERKAFLRDLVRKEALTKELARQHPKELAYWQSVQDEADFFFDQYLTKHRFEVKLDRTCIHGFSGKCLVVNNCRTYRRREGDTNIFLSFGIPFAYESKYAPLPFYEDSRASSELPDEVPADPSFWIMDLAAQAEFGVASTHGEALSMESRIPLWPSSIDA